VPADKHEVLRHDVAASLKGPPNEQVDMILNGCRAAANAGMDGRKPAPKR
jgi:hypothetical protein